MGGFHEYFVPGRGDDGTASQNSKKALEKSAINDMLQCLAQLVDVRTYATEIFTNLQKEAEATTIRMNNLKGRVHEVAQQVDPLDNIFHKSSPDCFYGAYATKKLARDSTPSGGFFIRIVV